MHLISGVEFITLLMYFPEIFFFLPSFILFFQPVFAKHQLSHSDCNARGECQQFLFQRGNTLRIGPSLTKKAGRILVLLKDCKVNLLPLFFF